MNGASADRNLLFGILALQLDFISRDALIAAMHAWVLAKQRPLGDILVELGALDAGRRALLETLVQEHLKQHGGDVGRSLAALPVPTPVCHSLAKLDDAEVRMSLATFAQEPLPSDDPYATQAFTGEMPLEPRARFQVLRLHAKGGLGEVHIALDRELNRQVALKEIQNRHADEPRSRERFVLEAEITGGLEHPGIVPVYGMGQYPDGWPYYAMRFIKGESLQEAIRSYFKANQGKPSLRGVKFRKLLGRFLAACDAVAYAHSRGVLHRDIKPSNIMLGPYGETLVVDWGLAKAAGRKETMDADTEPIIDPSSHGAQTPTLPGSVLGTPAYMSPEQAEGRLDRLGPASDVYSLGATLYCLLTGKPAFGEGLVHEVLRQVQRGEFPHPRQVNSRVPAALEAICLKAMATRLEERYSTPRELAEDLEHWLADEPVRAYAEPLPERARRWARRHKPLMAGCLGLVGTALLLGGIGLGWWENERSNFAHAIEKDLREAEDLLAKDNTTQAKQVLMHAQAQMDAHSMPRLSDSLERLKRDQNLAAQLQAARLRRASFANRELDFAGADKAYAAAFEEHQLDLAHPEATAQRIRTSTVRLQLILALDDWSFVKNNLPGGDSGPVLTLAQMADDDAWRNRVREGVKKGDLAALVAAAASEEAERQPDRALAVLGGVLAQKKAHQEALTLLRGAVQRKPQDFWINFDLARVLLVMEPANPEDAVGFLRAALALQPDNPAVYNNLGVALDRLGKHAQALQALQKAVEFQPNDTGFLLNMGNVLNHLKRYAEAEQAFGKAIALYPGYAEAHCNLGDVLKKQGRFANSLAAYRSGRELGSKSPTWKYRKNVEEWIKEVEELLRLDLLLPRVLSGAAQPADAGERANLGEVCLQYKDLPARAAQLFREAFEADPALAGAPNSTDRYFAARAAARAGTGLGRDATALDAEERACMRRQACVWLQDEVEGWRVVFDQDPITNLHGLRIFFRFLQQHKDDFAGVREAVSLAKLPDDERREWEAVWKKLDALRQRAGL
jgi:serine/threonine protein kinase/Tfp pilus assembly protein PilF